MSETHKAIRDTKRSSRKGRKPVGGHAMTAAERKRRQRRREREAKAELPNWLRLRHELWEVVQDKFAFANADELGNALEALGVAVQISNYYRSKHGTKWIHLWHAYCRSADLSAEDQKFVLTFFPELLPYRWQAGDSKFSDVKDAVLIELIGDMLDGHGAVTEGDG